jgi:hypothetical protein
MQNVFERLVGEKLVHRAPGAGTVVVANENPTVDKPCVEKMHSISRRLVEVEIDLGARTVINIDKQRVEAIRKLEALGYRYQGGKWVPASPSAATGPRSLMTAETDAMHGVLVQPGRCPRGPPRRV